MQIVKPAAVAWGSSARTNVWPEQRGDERSHRQPDHASPRQPNNTALYAHWDFGKAPAAQQEYLRQLLAGEVRLRDGHAAPSGSPSGWELGTEQDSHAQVAVRKRKSVVGATGFEPVTSTV